VTGLKLTEEEKEIF